MSALRKLRRKDPKFKASLGYIVRACLNQHQRLDWHTLGPWRLFGSFSLLHNVWVQMAWHPKASDCALQKDLYTAGASGTQPEVPLTSRCSCRLMTRPILKRHAGSESFILGQATPSSCSKQSPSFPENPTIVNKGLGKISFHLVKTPAPLDIGALSYTADGAQPTPLGEHPAPSSVQPPTWCAYIHSQKKTYIQ